MFRKILILLFSLKPLKRIIPSLIRKLSFSKSGSIILLDDFEGGEKGVINYIQLKKLKKLNSHFLVYPCERARLEKISETSHSTTAVLLPNSLIELVAQ